MFQTLILLCEMFYILQDLLLANLNSKKWITFTLIWLNILLQSYNKYNMNIYGCFKHWYFNVKMVGMSHVSLSVNFIRNKWIIFTLIWLNLLYISYNKYNMNIYGCSKHWCCDVKWSISYEFHLSANLIRNKWITFTSIWLNILCISYNKYNMNIYGCSKHWYCYVKCSISYKIYC